MKLVLRNNDTVGKKSRIDYVYAIIGYVEG